MDSSDNDIVLGIDPGVNGAFAFLDITACTLSIFDMPKYTVTTTKDKSYVDGVGVGVILRSRPTITHTFLERVHSSPQQGVVSAFSFGQSFGTVLGGLGALEMETTQVGPAVWKPAMAVTSDKKQTVARATQLMPACASAWKLVKHTDRAEASLIAYYGVLKLGYKIRKPIQLLEIGEVK